MDKEMPMCLKRKVFEQCVIPSLTYGGETWPLKIETIQKMRSTQRAMERKIIGVSLLDKINHNIIREQTKFKDVVRHILKMKWSWAGHIGRMTDKSMDKEVHQMAKEDEADQDLDGQMTSKGTRRDGRL